MDIHSNYAALVAHREKLVKALSEIDETLSSLQPSTELAVLKRGMRDISIYNFTEIRDFFLQQGFDRGIDQENTRGVYLTSEAACWYCGVESASFLLIPDARVVKRIVVAFVVAGEPSPPCLNKVNGPMPGAEFALIRWNVGGIMRENVLRIYN